MLRKRVRAPKPLGTRIIYINSHTHKITKNVSYSSYLRGKRLLRNQKVKQAKKNVAKRLVKKLSPPLGTLIDAAETLKDIKTIATKGK
jgi:hypothetical protein